VQIFLFTLSIIFFIYPVVSFTSQYFPDRQHDFFSLAVSGRDNMAGNFFLNDNRTVLVGEEHTWNIYVENQMNGLEYVSIRVKLANSSMSSPNTTSCLPSNSTLIFEVRKTLQDGEEWGIPLTWAIQEIISENSTNIVKQVEVNSHLVQVDLPSFTQTKCKLIVELWSYDINVRDFIFGWRGDKAFECAWNQVWFNLDTEG
jgi:hypothetical protein